MEKDKRNKEVPSCACGKTDLYEEWTKNNKQVETESKKENMRSSKKIVKHKDEKD